MHGSTASSAVHQQRLIRQQPSLITGMMEFLSGASSPAPHGQPLRRNSGSDSPSASEGSEAPSPSHSSMFTWGPSPQQENLDRPGEFHTLEDLSLDDVYVSRTGDSKSHILQAQLQQPPQHQHQQPPQRQHHQPRMQEPQQPPQQQMPFYHQPDFQPLVSNGFLPHIVNLDQSPRRGSGPASPRGGCKAKPRTYMQWIKHQRRTQQRAARRRSDAAAGRFDCQVPGCGKKYSSSGGIRYHLRNCSHEGLPQTATSLAQLADARAKEDAAKKRKATPPTDGQPQHSSDAAAPGALDDTQYDSSAPGSPMSPRVSMGSFDTDVDLGLSLFSNGLDTTPTWQPPMQCASPLSHHVVGPAPSDFGLDPVMMCLQNLDNAHLTGRRDDPQSDRQVPSSPRSLLSAFQSVPESEDPMIGLFEGL